MPVELNAVRAHEQVVEELQHLARVITPQAAGAAFVESLITRQLEMRSALGSLCLARVLPEHELDPEPGTYATICRTCGWSRMPEGEEEPISHLLGERHQYGGVRHDDPIYAHLDLTAFAALPELSPSQSAWRCLDLILRTPTLLAPDARVSDLERALKGAFKSNRNERWAAIRILSSAGVLQPRDAPSFFDGFVPPNRRILPPQRFADWGYPAIWWRAEHGVREEAVRFWFPQRGRSAG